MKIYDAEIFHKNTNQKEYRYIAKLDSELDQAFYNAEEYNDLFLVNDLKDSGFTDNDIAFYVDYETELRVGLELYDDAVLLRFVEV
jgi:hypothetical protein